MKCIVSKVALLLILFVGFMAQSADAQRVSDDPILQKLRGVEWYGIYIAGKKSGWAREELYESEYEGRPMLAVKSESSMKVAMMGIVQEIFTEAVRYFDPETGKFVAIENHLSAAGSDIVTKIRVEGDQLTGTVEMGGRSQEIRQPFAGDTIYDALGKSYWAAQDPKVGEKKSFTSFDTTIFQYIESQSELKQVSREHMLGVTQRVFTFGTTIPKLGLRVTAKFDENGRMLEDTMGNMLFRREEEESAKIITEVPDLVAENVIVPQRKIENSLQLARLVVEISGLEDSRLRIDDNRQEFEDLGDGKYKLSLARISPELDQIPERPMDLPDLRDHLIPEFLIQSDAPDVKALSEKIVGDTTNSLEAIREIVDWIRNNITQEFTATMSNALDTLHSRKGDCTEHAVIFVALCRAAGIPARPVGGIVYAPDGTGFYFHQWADVYLGKWIAVDPIFYQIPADSTHIKLIEGDLSKHAILINVFGKLKIEVLDYSHEGETIGQ